MKKIILFIIVSVIALSSCVTMSDPNISQHLQLPKKLTVVTDSGITASVSFDDRVWMVLEVENNTNEPVRIEPDNSSFAFPSGQTSKPVSEDTRGYDAGRSVPPIVVGAGEKFRGEFVSRNAISYNYGWRLSEWVPINPEGLAITIGYSTAGNDGYFSFKYDSQSANAPDWTTLGEVEVEKRFWNFLFLRSGDKRRKELFELAQEKALAEYGSDRLINLKYEGSWNGLSLLLYFSMLGFVEDATLTATVISP